MKLVYASRTGNVEKIVNRLNADNVLKIEYSGHPRASVPDLQGHLSGVSRPGKNYQSIPAPKACVPEL